VLVAGLIVALLGLGGAVWQSAALARDRRRFPPPGRLVETGRGRLHATCEGRDGPTVLLESAIAASSMSWTRVRPEVAGFASVCAYDRSGLGWSDAPSGSWSFARVVDDLHECLRRLECPRPYVLVGHSFGVFVCLAYAARYPQQVAGLVLVDPPSEWVHMDERRSRLLRGGVLLSHVGWFLARVGVVRACLTLLTGGAPAVPRHFVQIFGPTAARTLERLVGEIRKLPAEVHPVVQALWCQPKCFLALAGHLRILREATAAAAAVHSLGDIPVAVISSGDQTPDVAASHRALAELSSRGRVVSASKSGHWVPYDEPELVVEVIRETVEIARRFPGHRV